MTDRWLLYGHDLSDALHPISIWLMALGVLIVILLLIHVVGMIGVRSRQSSMSVAVMEELTAMHQQLASMLELRDTIIEVTARITAVESRLSEQAGMIAGAIDAARSVATRSAEAQSAAFRALSEERKRIESAINEVHGFLARFSSGPVGPT